MACKCGTCTPMRTGVRPFYLPIQATQSTARPILLGFYTKEDWDHHQPLHIFRCLVCFQVRYSFPCFGERKWNSIPHFHCDHCTDNLYVINDWRIYKSLLGGEDPPIEWQQFVYEAEIAFVQNAPPCIRDASLRP